MFRRGRESWAKHHDYFVSGMATRSINWSARETLINLIDFPPTETSPIGEERGETAVFEGYFGDSKQRNCIAIPLNHLSCPFCCQIFNTTFLRTVSTFRKKISVFASYRQSSQALRSSCYGSYYTWIESNTSIKPRVNAKLPLTNLWFLSNNKLVTPLQRNPPGVEATISWKLVTCERTT